MYKLTDNVNVLTGVGPKTTQNLVNAGFSRIEDLIWHIPYRYEDQTKKAFINELTIEDKFAVSVEIIDIKRIFTRSRKNFVKATASDNTGQLDIFWFNQPYVTNYIKKGATYTFFGQISDKKSKPTFTNPTYIKGDTRDSDASIVPIYSKVQGLNNKWFSSKIKTILDNIEEVQIIPENILAKHHLLSFNNAIKIIHFPNNIEDLKDAKRTLAYQEVLLMHLKGQHLKRNWHQKEMSVDLEEDNTKIEKFIDKLPFKLTNSQLLVSDEVLSDLTNKSPMNRLLQGDVGSGKTMVALIASLKILLNNSNVLYLAPTQILASQHYSTFNNFLKDYNFDIQLLTSNTKIEEHKTKKPTITIGTHAILHHLNKFNNISLIIIDEQHKFGVKQRTTIKEHFTKGDKVPNLLTMTATPIPRSVALSIYGDLDLSMITEYPSNRKQVKTYVVKESKRNRSYKWIKDKIEEENLQVIFVCPFIEQSEAENLQQVKAAEVQYKELESVFWEYKLSLLHGRMKNNEKDEIINNFVLHKTDILVTTPVIEVGVDIPNANIIFIETAERFGLASLHQLRGRVGRGEKQGYCVLMSSNEISVNQRLKHMEKIHSGHKLSEIDLQLRGPGNIYGVEQSGILNLKVADYSDLELLKNAKQDVEELLENADNQTNYIKDYLKNIDIVNND